jgi:hypothetical protein
MKKSINIAKIGQKDPINDDRMIESMPLLCTVINVFLTQRERERGREGEEKNMREMWGG